MHASQPCLTPCTRIRTRPRQAASNPPCPCAFAPAPQVRKVMNALDNEREGRVTDVLLNYETVRGRSKAIAVASCLLQPSESNGPLLGNALYLASCQPARAPNP